MANAKKVVVLGFLVALGLAGALHAATALRVVDADTVDHVQFTASRGELMYVAIHGDGDTDLDLYILDHNGNVVASDLTWTDEEDVFFYAPYSGTFYAAVQNLGGVYNQYRIWVE